MRLTRIRNEFFALEIVIRNDEIKMFIIVRNAVNKDSEIVLVVESIIPEFGKEKRKNSVRLVALINIIHQPARKEK